METNQTFILSEKAKKFLAYLVSKQMLVNGGKATAIKTDNAIMETKIRVTGDSLKSEYLQLHHKEVNYIIEGRTLDLLNTFFFGHRFIATAKYQSIPEISEVLIDIIIDTIY